MGQKRDAGVLRCPGCGSNVAPDITRCPYCKARLATISCPSCFALMFDTAAYCQACGARRTREADEDVAARCPACRDGMRRVAVGGTTILECGKCDAVWVDAADFERICVESEAQAAVLHQLAPRQTVRTAPVRYRKCLRCGTVMNRMNFGQISGTIVDACRGHGTFLDAGELHAIVTFIRGGGLEVARKRRLQELKDQERQLEMREWRATKPGESAWTSERETRSSGSLLDLLDLLRGD